MPLNLLGWVQISKLKGVLPFEKAFIAASPVKATDLRASVSLVLAALSTEGSL